MVIGCAHVSQVGAGWEEFRTGKTWNIKPQTTEFALPHG
jgi:hypothetical protein